MSTFILAGLSMSVAMLLFAGFGCAGRGDGAAMGADAARNAEAVEANLAAKVLDLRGQKLSTIPDEVLHNIRLEELDVSDNRIEGTLSPEIGRLRRLKVFRASGNGLTVIPPEIGRLRELEVLDLSRNRISALPREIADLRALRELNVQGNPYSEEDLRTIADRLPDLKIIK